MCKSMKNIFSQDVISIRMYIQQMKEYHLYVYISGFIFPFLSVLLQILFWESMANVSLIYGEKIVTYVILINAFRNQFNIYTPATTALWEGSIVRYYTRPMGIFRQLVIELIGKSWIPQWLMFTLPLLIIMNLWGIDMAPASRGHLFFFVLSMFFSVVLGLEIDVIFAAIAIRLENGCWAAEQIRNALIIILSGQLIPFQLLPYSIGKVLSILPFGSIASAPISIYIGEEIVNRLLLQFSWSILIGIASYVAFKKSEERMISLGG